MTIRAVLFFLVVSLYSCYSFRGTNIASTIDTFYVEQTSILAGLGQTPGDLPELFMESLRAKVRNQSRLTYDDRNPDITFESEITSFVLGDEARAAGNVSTLLKIAASIKVTYIDNQDEDNNWTSTFSHTVNYDPSINIQEAQDGFIEEILDQISEQAFNKAFTNW